MLRTTEIRNLKLEVAPVPTRKELIRMVILGKADTGRSSLANAFLHGSLADIETRNY